MYQINMLKGSQLHEKHWPSILLAGIAFVVPIALAFVISIAYFNDKAALVTQDEKISDYEFQLRDMEEAKKRVDSVVLAIQNKTSSLSDVEEVLGRHIQWSDILIAISENLPDTLVVNKLEVIKSSAKRIVDRRYGVKKKINITIPARTLVISLYSESAEGDDAAVRNLQRNLIKSAAFQRCVKDVVIATREPDSIDGKDVVHYELNCILKLDKF
jgi:hypothetical protein